MAATLAAPLLGCTTKRFLNSTHRARSKRSLDVIQRVESQLSHNSRVAHFGKEANRIKFGAETKKEIEDECIAHPVENELPFNSERARLRREHHGGIRVSLATCELLDGRCTGTASKIRAVTAGAGCSSRRTAELHTGAACRLC